ncbi:MAG: tRNA dimethylallyltransferase, partial [Eubacteriales bacterium]|nr:tRNA dimethylallyltransferase [Eubacteriales bacterium]
KRVDLMLDSGLVEEVKYLFSLGYSKIPPMQGLGYKEIGWYLRGESTLEEASELLKRNTRRFSKRQLTWFRRMDEIKWIDVNDNTQMREIVKLIQNDIATTGIIL